MSAPPTDPWITHVLGEDDAESDFFSSDNDVESDNHSNDHGDKAVYSREEVSALLPVREVAMMDIMSKLTDKPEWDRKVFDEDIVAKWKEEAMALPDDVWVKIAAAEGSEWIRPRESRFPRPRPIPGILSEEAWNYVSVLPVCIATYPTMLIIFRNSVSRSYAAKLVITRRRVWSRLWMLLRR